MTPAERESAIAQILAECHGNYGIRVVVETAHRLQYPISEIGSERLIRAADEAATAQLKQKEAA